MKKLSVPDKKQLQQRRLLIDEEFKKERVELSDHDIKDEQIKMCEKKTVKFITILELNRNSLTHVAMNSIVSMKWKQLTRIQLCLKSHRKQGLQESLEDDQSNTHTNLPEYCISFSDNNQIDSSGVAHLSKSQWAKLESIILYHNKIGEEGIDYLLKSNWPNATFLHLCWNDIKIEKKVWLALGRWRKIKVIGLLEGEENKFSGLVQSLLLKQRYPKVDLSHFTVIGLYDTA